MRMKYLTHLGDHDEHGLFDKLYVGRFWEPELDGTTKILQWDMFVDKSSFLDVIRDYMVHEGIYIKIMKNEPARYTAKCETQTTIGGYIHMFFVMVQLTK